MVQTEQTNSFADHMQSLLTPTSRGVVGLVDDLLSLGDVIPFRMHFDEKIGVICEREGEVQETVFASLPKSVFRAVLARIAVLCNECRPQSTTPYDGQGEIEVADANGAHKMTATKLQVRFTNTASRQELIIRKKVSGTVYLTAGCEPARICVT